MTSTRQHGKTVVLISPTAEAGGSDQALARMLPALSRDGFECHVVVPAEPALRAAFQSAGAVVHVVPMRRISSGKGLRWWLRYTAAWPRSVLRIAAIAGETNASLIASNSLHSWYGFAVALLMRRPHLWHAREIVVQSALALRLERVLVSRCATMLVSCSAAVQSQFDDVLPDRRKIVLLEDVDRTIWSPRRRGRFRNRMGIASDTPLVGFVGRIDTWKGVDVLLEAWPMARAAWPAAELVVAGGPVAGKESYFEQLRVAAAAQPGVHWLGPRENVPDLMADLEVLVLPSTSPEPYGLVIVEALASGARVVVSEGGGPSEILTLADSGAGHVVGSGDVAGVGQAIGAALLASAHEHGDRAARLSPLTSDVAAAYRAALHGHRGRRCRRQAPSDSPSAKSTSQTRPSD
jgi:glycosyltransferase involved in cell wall biosynthesis